MLLWLNTGLFVCINKMLHLYNMSMTSSYLHQSIQLKNNNRGNCFSFDALQSSGFIIKIYRQMLQIGLFCAPVMPSDKCFDFSAGQSTNHCNNNIMRVIRNNEKHW